ncbi:peptidase M61 [Fulvivirga lutimaris]|uniref:M61 family metallopeptidase n=1 Tax=Fulvivirga lutimaris TaxID=1819566 RepID=UPI0012BB68A7|nr:peptidase M61 [Fulvivirga lutimaris]MTI38760.1 peptidase M61 [Fulvivirga lutimaris]
MRKVISALLLIVMVVGQVAATTGPEGKMYKFKVDLTVVKDDRVQVELQAPKIDKDEIIYYMPKIIPGTYSIADYGRFVIDLKALDKKGRELEVERLDDNSWKILGAKKLTKLTYWVEDSYDSDKAGPNIFQPAGTNIEDGKNFIINTAGFFGYFEGMKQMPIDFDIVKPENFYGGTGLISNNVSNLNASLEKENTASATKNIDSYTVENYDRLIDSPLMYSEADTAIIKVANAEVLISSYSPNKMVSAKDIAGTLSEILTAQNQYLGGKLPVDKYAFVFYFTDQPVTSYGALEHSYSSVYYMPENRIVAMQQQLRDFAAHEFFHIVTPLNIHSEEIHHFDFNDPKMSKHLWMYEGVTEFFAGNMQVKYDIISKEQYLQVLSQKMSIASQFLDTVAFTDISKYTLDKYSNQYYNVYQKGALIGMSLDILLRDLSQGEYGVQNLMADLAKEYGKDQAFTDDELFGKITELTYPEIGEFLNTYVGGDEPLPYKEIYEKVGVNYSPQEFYKAVDLGLTQASLGIDSDLGALYINNKDALNEFGKALGFENGDILLQINGDDIPSLGPELPNFLGQKQQELIVGEPFSYTVKRGEEEVTLSNEVIEIDKVRMHGLSFDEDASQEQIKIRNSWLEAK